MRDYYQLPHEFIRVASRSSYWLAQQKPDASGGPRRPSTLVVCSD
jgi:hypothetical protein